MDYIYIYNSISLCNVIYNVLLEVIQINQLRLNHKDKDNHCHLDPDIFRSIKIS